MNRKARFVDEKKCVGCGDCMAKCPTKTADEYNQYLGQRKANLIKRDILKDCEITVCYMDRTFGPLARDMRSTTICQGVSPKAAAG